MELVADEVGAEEQGGHDSDEDEQAPTGAKAVFPDENIAEPRGLERREGIKGRQRVAIIIMIMCQRRVIIIIRSVIFRVQGISSCDNSLYARAAPIVATPAQGRSPVRDTLGLSGPPSAH